jgi:hypothetical protein
MASIDFSANKRERPTAATKRATFPENELLDRSLNRKVL